MRNHSLSKQPDRVHASGVRQIGHRTRRPQLIRLTDFASSKGLEESERLFSQVLDAATSTCAAKQLAARFGGDPSSADWRHFGRLAGFTNPKPERQLPSGMRPFARLRSATGRTYLKVAEFVAAIRSSEAGQERQSEELPKRRRRRVGRVAVRPLDEFHTAPAYAGDLHRADMAWAKHTAGRGLTLEQIKIELLNGRDLSKKGSRKRQLEYAERTARKAMEQMQ